MESMLEPAAWAALAAAVALFAALSALVLACASTPLLSACAALALSIEAFVAVASLNRLSIAFWASSRFCVRALLAALTATVSYAFREAVASDRAVTVSGRVVAVPDSPSATDFAAATRPGLAAVPSPARAAEMFCAAVEMPAETVSMVARPSERPWTFSPTPFSVPEGWTSALSEVRPS